jgi:hypothetical protein
MVRKDKYGVDQITKYVKKSKFAGNAVVINREFILASDKGIREVCPLRNGEKLMLFAVFDDGGYYQLDRIRSDANSDLALLRIVADALLFLDLKSFVAFPSSREEILGKNILMLETVNSSKFYRYEKYKIRGISSDGYNVRGAGVADRNIGNSVLNDRFELVGISNGRDKEPKHPKETSIISQNKIESFLRNNRISYYKVGRDAKIQANDEYLRNINVKLICFVVRAPMNFGVRFER